MPPCQNRRIGFDAGARGYGQGDAKRHVVRDDGFVAVRIAPIQLPDVAIHVEQAGYDVICLDDVGAHIRREEEPQHPVGYVVGIPRAHVRSAQARLARIAGFSALRRRVAVDELELRPILHERPCLIDRCRAYR